ncbi:MAG: guanylate kinase [Bacteroidetes bacterium]|nr:MAG: guanylate kinase [Bacteroidota bacterium]
MSGKAIIFSAPSGAGKTTLVKHILAKNPNISFSISACSRPRRENERKGKDYYFLSEVDFKSKIKNNEFIEWEEVYKGNYYGTLKAEIERVWSEGKHVIFDVDVIGGLNLKKYFKDNALAVFVKPPSIKTLGKRLNERGTETIESMAKRIEKAVSEMGYADQFDKIIVNDDLEIAKVEAEKLVGNFLNS